MDMLLTAISPLLRMAENLPVARHMLLAASGCCKKTAPQRRQKAVFSGQDPLMKLYVYRLLAGNTQKNSSLPEYKKPRHLARGESRGIQTYFL